MEPGFSKSGTYMKVYLAGPINGCTDAQAKSWRAEASELLKSHGFEVIDPMVRDYRGKEADNISEIVEQDKSDIDSCDVVMVYYERPSVGTSMEVLYAYDHPNQKIVLIVDRSDKPLSPWLVYHSHHISNSIKEAVGWLCFSPAKTE